MQSKIAPRTLIVFGLALLALSPCVAQPADRAVTVHLDPAQTKIEWTLGDVLHTVHGTFQLKGGMVTFDPATGVAQGEVLVDASSGESGDKTRDGKMQKNVLESQKYPEIIFHPAKVTGEYKPGMAEDISVAGTFTIHGADHPLTLKVHVQPQGSELTMTAQFDVPYVAWGMKDPSTFVLRVSKEVAIDVTAHGTVTQGR